ncbi:MAG: hypothetical protein IKN63_04080 [Bacilli bacterium]|nr:hypothetical protein [Bacilli bacterium]
MNIKEYNSLEPKIEFYSNDSSIYFKVNNNLYIYNNTNIEYLKNMLELPYKISFYGLSNANIERILNDLKNNDNRIFCYRVKNPKTDTIVFHAIVTKKIKIKKL